MNRRRTTYCENCGERLPDGVPLCPNCGAPAPVEVPSRDKPRRRRLPAVIAVTAAALALGAGWLLANRLAASPVTRFLSYHTALFSSRVLEPLQALEEQHVPGQLSGDVTVTGRTDSEALAPYLEGSSLALQADVDGDSALLGCRIDLLGSTVLNGTVTYADGQLGVWLPELDENYYVMDLAPALRDAAGTEPDLSGPLLPRLSPGELRQALAPYWDAVTALVNEQNITRQRDVSGILQALPFAGACDVYAFRPTEESLQAFLLALADILEQEGGLRALIGETLGSALVQLGVSSLGEEDAQARLDGALTWLAGVLRDNAPVIAGELAEAGFTWSVAVEDGQVRQIRLAVTDPDSQTDTGLAYECTGGQGTLDEALYAFAGGQVRQALRRHWETGGGTASGTVALSDGDTDLLTVDFAAEDGRTSPLGLPYGRFTFTAPGLPSALSLTVEDGDGGGTDHVLSLAGLEDATGGLFDRLDLTVNAVSGSSVTPPEPSPVDVTGYSDEQMEEITGKMGKTLRNDLLANLWPLMGYVLR